MSSNPQQSRSSITLSDIGVLLSRPYSENIEHLTFPALATHSNPPPSYRTTMLSEVSHYSDVRHTLHIEVEPEASEPEPAPDSDDGERVRQSCESGVLCPTLESHSPAKGKRYSQVAFPEPRPTTRAHDRAHARVSISISIPHDLPHPFSIAMMPLPITPTALQSPITAALASPPGPGVRQAGNQGLPVGPRAKLVRADLGVKGMSGMNFFERKSVHLRARAAEHGTR